MVQAWQPSSREDVEPDVVDDRLAEPLGDLVDERVALVLRQPGDVPAEDHRPQERLERLAGLEPGRLRRGARPATSTKPAAASQRRRSPRASRSASSPSQPSPIVARTARTEAMLPPPPHWATSRPPGRMTAARLRKSASWSGTQWNVAVERIASTGAAGQRERPAEVGHDVLDPVAEPREAARGPRRPSTASASRATTRPRGRRSARSSVTRPLPQPASRTRLVAAQLEPLEDGRAPARLGLGDAVVGPAVPVARCRHARRISAGIERPRPVGARPRSRGSGGAQAAGAVGLITTECA